MAESEANVVYSPMARREDFRRPPDSSAHREIVRERASFWDSFFDKVRLSPSPPPLSCPIE